MIFFFFIDKMFCVPDPKEAITFLEKTKEKVSPLTQTLQTLIYYLSFFYQSQHSGDAVNPNVYKG